MMDTILVAEFVKKYRRSVYAIRRFLKKHELAGLSVSAEGNVSMHLPAQDKPAAEQPPKKNLAETLASQCPASIDVLRHWVAQGRQCESLRISSSGQTTALSGDGKAWDAKYLLLRDKVNLEVECVIEWLGQHGAPTATISRSRLAVARGNEAHWHEFADPGSSAPRLDGVQENRATVLAREQQLEADRQAALRYLDAVYPEDIFTGVSGDAGPRAIALVRDLLRRQERKDGAR